MQTKHLFLLPALAFLACANLCAQVTIGGLDNPKDGAILDLNSTVKGGLILSNVNLEELSKIPSSFPDVSGIDDAVLKAGLRGSVIYNTNPDFCTGVHVWNGNFWERVASGNPDSIPGTLSITSGSNNSLGGDLIGFTAAPGAKIYRWYASLNEAPYEYIGLTTTETFSTTFPAGNNKVKVVMDDCQSLKKSNEVTFAPDALSPNFGSVAGGNIIYIYGDFPYAATSEYESDGLVAHYDGINNTGQGDKLHSGTTISWKNLIPNTVPDFLPDGEMCLDNSCSTKGQNSNLSWTNNSAYFGPNNGDNDIISWFRINKHYNPLSYTLEVAYSSNTSQVKGQDLVANWQGGGFGFILGSGESSAHPELKQHASIAAYIKTDAYPSGRYEYSNGIHYELNEIQSLSAQYLDYGDDGCALATYVNGEGNITTVSTTKSTQGAPGGNTVWAIGANPDGTSVTNTETLQNAHIYSVRIYNKSLDIDRIKHNSDLDKKRYLAPPTVTIGDVPCTEVVVLSPHFLMCKVPLSATTGPKNVVINGNITYNGAYTYVDASEFYVSSISPIVGSADGTLTLTGNNLNTITKLEVGGNVCPNPTTQNSGKYECTLPSHAPGEVDITITIDDDGDEKTYRFAKVFEYQ